MRRKAKDVIGRISRIRTFSLTLVLSVSGFYCVSCGSEGGSVATLPETETSSESPSSVGSEKQMDTASSETDYSRFLHTSTAHSRLPCLLCHRSEDDSARMQFPGKRDHLPCSGCHKVEMSDPANPMCTICHTSAETGSMRPFPPLKSFGARFEHAVHLPEAGCTTCHRPTKLGLEISIPRGGSAHATCLQCHSSDRPIGSCSVCHELGQPVLQSQSSKKVGFGFGHREHDRARGVNCTSCHTVRAGAARTRQVSSPKTAMHFVPSRTTSCATCHNDRRAFGVDNFANCRRCHQGKSFRF